MDIKIKKEQESNRHLDIPQFKSSDEINREFDHTEPEDHSVEPGEPVRLERHEDELQLTTQMITTQIDTDSFDTLEVDTIDLENDLKVIEATQNPQPDKREEDTIKINQTEHIELEDGDEIEQPRREFNINLRYVYLTVAILILLIIGFVSYNVYIDMTSQERLINNALENQYPISDINIYGESVNLISDKPLNNVDLYNIETEERTTQELGKSIDQQLHFSAVEAGTYYMFVGDQIITSSNDIEVKYQTIMRDGVSKNVEFSTNEQKIVEAHVADNNSSKVDILIDPSQGDIQGFTASDDKTTEQELSLKYALSLKSNLQQYGYNVKLTRDDDSVPGGCAYDEPYCDSGRVAMAYEDNPKLYILIGFNGTNGSGFEITDSNLNSHTLARLIKSSLSPLISPSERVSGQLEAGIFNKTYNDEDGNKIDYLYLIRETGGLLMNSDNQDASDFNTNPVGAETIEIDPGYISEDADFEKLNDDSEIDSFTKALATAIDQYINRY